MKHIKKTISLLIPVFLLGICEVACGQSWNIPPLPPAEQYGNLIIDRISGRSGRTPVTFSHWKHRTRHTCRVCHLELEFEMKVNTSEITEEKNRNGQFCGACHDGTKVFGHTEGNCPKCHNGDISYGKEKFNELAVLPPAPYGNHVDWTQAAARGLIAPKQSIRDDAYRPEPFKKSLTMEPEWAKFAPAVFPHDAHVYWLDCANCHPDIFHIKKKTTEHFTMNYITKGKFCGVCHLSVAFPLNNCKRCHPELKR